MAHAISLLRLPNTAIKRVLQISDARELIIFSTLSARTKRLVRSINRKTEWMHFNPQYGFIISIYWVDFVEFGDNGPNGPCTLAFRYPSRNPQFTKPEFGVREWLEHFMFIFNNPMIHVQFEQRDDWVYTYESVQKLLEGLKIKQLEIHDNFEVLKHYPITNSLTLGNDDLGPEPEDLTIIWKTLLGNVARVELNRSIPFNLDILLMMNSCEYIRSNDCTFSDKELNTFLRLWLKGSHRNLKMVELYCRSQAEKTFNERIVFKGIKYDRRECFNPRFLGAYDIVRKVDGTEATAMLTKPPLPLFRIVVRS